MNVQDIEKIASDLTKYVTEIAKQYGPQAWGIVCNVKRMDSLGLLLTGCVWLCLFVLTFFLRSQIPKWTEGWKRDDRTAAYIVSFGASFICFLVVCNLLFNIWNWVGVFDPGIAIAHDVMQKALESSSSK